MDKLTKLLEAIQGFLTAIGAYFMGYQEGSEEANDLKKKLLEEETKRKLLENEIANAKKFDSTEPVDLVNDIVGRSKPK